MATTLSNTSEFGKAESLNSSGSVVANTTAVPGIHPMTMAINSFMPWLLIVIGCVANALTVLGMRTKYFRSVSTAVYMTVSAVNDFFALPIALVAHWVYMFYPESIIDSERADILCKFFNFYGWGQSDVGIGVITAMTVDRAYAIVRPMTSVDLTLRAKVVISVTVTLVCLKDLHLLFSSDIVRDGRRERMCDAINPPSESYAIFYRHVWPWIHATFLTLCFVCMLASNLVIISHVRQRATAPSSPTPGGTPLPRNLSASNRSLHLSSRSLDASPDMQVHSKNYDHYANHVTKMLLAESCTLLLLTYPFSVHLVVTSFIGTPDRSANALAFNVVFYMLYANKCVSFFVYCLAGKRFREAVLNDILCPCFEKIRRSVWQYRFSGSCGQSARDCSLDTDKELAEETSQKQPYVCTIQSDGIEKEAV